MNLIKLAMFFILKFITLILFYVQPFIDREALLMYIREFFPSDSMFFFSLMLGVNYLTRIIVDIFYMTIYYFQPTCLEKYRINNEWLWNTDDHYNIRILKTILHYGLLNLIIFIPLTYISFNPNIDYTDVDPWYISFIQIMFSLILYDAMFYIIHRSLHSKYLFWIHKMHHEYINTVIWADANTGLIEVILVAVLPNIIIGNIIHMKMYTQLMLIVVSISLGISQHSNYLLPYSPFDLIPFGDTIGGHVEHHRLRNVNFAPYWSYLDRIFNTYKA